MDCSHVYVCEYRLLTSRIVRVVNGMAFGFKVRANYNFMKIDCVYRGHDLGSTLNAMTGVAKVGLNYKLILLIEGN